jgi:hypothetical protein
MRSLVKGAERERLCGFMSRSCFVSMGSVRPSAKTGWPDTGWEEIAATAGAPPGSVSS